MLLYEFGGDWTSGWQDMTQNVAKNADSADVVLL
jgi:hypothetical protein